MTTEPENQIEQQIEPQAEQEQTPAPPQPSPPVAITAFDAGGFAARVLMKQMGRPGAIAWFQQNAPDMNDPQSVAESGRPIEFWGGIHSELKSVAGTA